MEASHTLSDAKAIVLAAHFCTEGDLPNLRVLAGTKWDVVTPELLYSLLLTLYSSEDEALSGLAVFLTDLESLYDRDATPQTLDTSAIQDLSEREAEQEVRNLVLRPISSTSATGAEDLLSSFLVSFVHRQASISELSPSGISLVDSFVEGRPELRTWRDSYLLPALRLQYEYYPENHHSVSLSELEKLQGQLGIARLLEPTVQGKKHKDIERDLDNIVAPWIEGAKKQKRRKLSVDSSTGGRAETSWQDLNEWILTTSLSDFSLATEIISQWDGPHGTNGIADSAAPSPETIRYAQTALALVYATSKPPEEALEVSQRMISRAASLVDVVLPDLSNRTPDIHSTFTGIQDASRADMLRNALLLPDNALTKPTQDALEFLRAVTSTERLLLDYKVSLCAKDIAGVCLFGSEERQKQELRRILQQVPKLTRTRIEWPLVRHHLLWLRSWHMSRDVEATEVDSGTRMSFLSHVDLHHLENEVLKAILSAGSYNDVVSIYIANLKPDLPLEEVEHQIIAAIFQHYDNATNGNRTRGGVKRALEMLQTFRGHFADSARFRQIDHLIRATHSLSFYQLTLQHNTPCLPVNIRVHKDPISLIGKVLEQNRSAYAHLDDMLEIGRNLIQAGLPMLASDSLPDSESLDSKMFHVQHRITYMAITSALSFHDFDTAYSYITTRLSSSSTNTQMTDDTSWRAAYAAGKYRPPASAASQPLHTRITSLQKRMDLLSLALSLAPSPDPLPEILGTWRRSEEELDNLKARAVEEERAFEGSSNTSGLPGGFGLEDREMDAAETKKALANRWSAAHPGSGPSYEEVIPAGLFDVARGAADALRKSAFPLRASTTTSRTSPTEQNAQGYDDLDSGDESHPTTWGGEHGQRVRKRDMVANAVAGGLVSGMSWVLGAPRPGSAGSQ